MKEKISICEDSDTEKKNQRSENNCWLINSSVINCNERKYLFPELVNGEIGQHIRPTDKPELQESKEGIPFFLFDKYMVSNIHKIKPSVILAAKVGRKISHAKLASYIYIYC